MLFAIWHEIPMRPTRDVDLLGFGSPEVERLADISRSICVESVIDDGLTFDPESVNATPIRETNAYHGVRIRPGATLSGAKIPLQVDVGFGDAIVPDRRCFGIQASGDVVGRPSAAVGSTHRDLFRPRHSERRHPVERLALHQRLHLLTLESLDASFTPTSALNRDTAFSARLCRVAPLEVRHG